MPALRVDWQSIKAALADPSAAYVFILPDGARQLLLAIADQLSWEATYRAYGYDYSDWDFLQEVHDAGVNGLLGGVPLDLLLSYLDEIEPLLEEIRDKPCCPDDSMPVPGSDESGPIGVETDTTGEDVVVGVGDPPGDHVDWASYNAHLCDAATKFADGLPKLMDLYSTASTLARLSLTAVIGLVAAAFAGFGLVGAIMAATVGLIDFLALVDTIRDAIAGSNPWSQHKADLSDATFRQEVICAFMLNSTAEGAYNSVVAALTTHAPNAASLVLAFPIELAIRRIYNADSDAAGGFGGSCTECTDSYDFVATWDWTRDGTGDLSWPSQSGNAPAVCLDAFNTNSAIVMVNDASVYATAASLVSRAGEPALTSGDVIRINRVDLHYKMGADFVDHPGRSAQLEINLDGGGLTAYVLPLVTEETVTVRPQLLASKVGAGPGAIAVRAKGTKKVGTDCTTDGVAPISISVYCTVETV